MAGQFFGRVEGIGVGKLCAKRGLTIGLALSGDKWRLARPQDTLPALVTQANIAADAIQPGGEAGLVAQCASDFQASIRVSWTNRPSRRARPAALGQPLQPRFGAAEQGSLSGSASGIERSSLPVRISSLYRVCG